MELLQLRYFIDAATSQNFSETARKYLVPPSSVSQSIKRLETELDAPLFIRTANKAILSPAGKHFLTEAKAALSILDNAKETIKSLQNNTVIRIHLHMHRHLTTDAISQFQLLHPETTFTTTYGTIKSPADYDMIVTYAEKDFPGFLKSAVAQEQFALAYHKNYFNFPNIITKQDIQGKPFVTTGENEQSVEGYTYSFCRMLGAEPNIAIRTEDPYYMRQCIEQGRMIAVVPTLSWQGQFSENVTLRPLDLPPRTTYIYISKNATPIQRQFFELLSKQLQNMQPDIE